MGGLSAHSPDAAGRNLDERHQVADGAGEGGGVALGPPLPQQYAEFLSGARPFLQQCSAGGGERLDVHPLDAHAVGAVTVEAAVDDRLHQGAEREAVAGAHQVDGVAHERDAHRVPVQDQAGQLVGVKALQPCPKPDVRRGGGLGLHADQVLDRVFGGEPLAAQQHLSLQRGAVERTRGENRRIGHSDSSFFEDVRMLSTVALDTCPSGTCVSVALLIASASSLLPRC